MSCQERSREVANPSKYYPGTYQDKQLSADMKAIFDLHYAIPYDIDVNVVGKPGAGAIILSRKLPRAVSFASKFAGSTLSVGTNPTNQANFSIKKNGNVIGAIAVTPKGAVTFSSTVAGLQLFNVNDVLTVTAPAVQDSTLSDIGLILVGSL
jgi:hypothetical protein